MGWVVSVWFFCDVLRPEYQNFDRSIRQILHSEISGSYPTPPFSNAGRTTNFAPVKSFRNFELFLELSLFDFCFTVFFPLGCGVDS